MGLGDHYRLDPPCLIHCQSIHEHSEPADSVSEKWTSQTNSSGGMKRVGNMQVQQKKGYYHARSDGYALVNPALGGPYFLIAAAVGMVEASRTAVCKIVLLTPLSTLRSIKPTDCTKIKNSISNPVCELIYMLLKICSLHKK